MLAAIPFPDISPEIFTITAFGTDFSLRWYAMGYIVGILIGWRIAVMLVRRAHLWAADPPMSAKEVEDFLTWIILGIILGGRLGYVFFYQPGYFLANPGDIPKLWDGGMSFHGGFLGVCTAVYYQHRKTGARLGELADILAVATPPGILLVRLTNFINAELWGRPTDMPWGVIFPGQAAQTCPSVPAGECARHPSQIYEAGLEGLVLGVILLVLAFARGWLKTPWFLTAVFFIGYGVSRFIVEFFRQADAQFITPENPIGFIISFGPAGVTMGQLLSTPMILIGLAIWAFARRRA